MSLTYDPRPLDPAWPTPEHIYDEWFAMEGECPMCEERSTLFAAIDIVVDGDQIAESCHGCGRIVRPFSWHEDDGLPVTYLGTINPRSGLVSVAAWYESGEVRSVPAVDEDCPTTSHPPGPIHQRDVARAILAHLVGIDVPEAVWDEFDHDIVIPSLAPGDGEWMLDVDEVIDWLGANR